MTDKEIRTLALQAISAWGELETDTTGKRDALAAWIFAMFRPHVPKESGP
jgi:hypothetical protein